MSKILSRFIFVILIFYPPGVAAEEELLLPTPVLPSEDSPFAPGIWEGEKVLFFGAGGTLWKYGFITRRWARLHTGGETVLKILGSESAEGVWVLTPAQALYLAPQRKKPYSLPLPQGLGGDRLGRRILLYNRSAFYLGEGESLKGYSTPQGISAAVLYREGVVLLEERGALLPLFLSQPPAFSGGEWEGIARCGEELFGYQENRWHALLPGAQNALLPALELLCSEVWGGVVLEERGLWHLRTQAYLGVPLEGALGKGVLFEERGRIGFAALFPQGIRVRFFALPDPSRGASQGYEHCLRPLQELLPRVATTIPLPETDLEGWLKRSRRAGWVPRLRIAGDLEQGLGYTFNEAIPYSTSTERGVILIGPTLDTLDRSRRLTYAARLELTWNLDRLVFSDDETRIVAAWERVLRERERELLFAQSLWEILARPEASFQERAGARAVFQSLWGVDPWREGKGCKERLP